MNYHHGQHRPQSAKSYTHHHDFDDPSTVAQRLDASERDALQKPDEVIASFQLSRDATIAEIGAGTGYFVVRLAKYLTNGTVIGLDSQPRMVAYLQRRAEELGLTNVDARQIQGDALPLTEQLDVLFCVDAYHHIADRVALFSRYAKHLKRGGKLVIIDRPADAPAGPPAESCVSPRTVQKELAQAGYTMVAGMNFLLPHQYYLAFTPTTTA